MASTRIRGVGDCSHCQQGISECEIKQLSGEITHFCLPLFARLLVMYVLFLCFVYFFLMGDILSLLMHLFCRAMQSMEEDTKARKIWEMDIPLVTFQHKVTEL